MCVYNCLLLLLIQLLVISNFNTTECILHVDVHVQWILVILQASEYTQVNEVTVLSPVSIVILTDL